MIITPRGIGFAAVAILIFFLGTYTRVGWLYMIDSVLWGTFVISAVMPWLAIGKPRINRKLVDWKDREDFPGPMEEDIAEFDITVTNTGWLPCMFVTARHDWGKRVSSPDKARMFIAWLGRNAQVTFRVQVKFEKRGVRQFPPIRFETRVPFGMFRRTRWAENPVEVTILPKVYSFDGIEMLASMGDIDSTPSLTRLGDQVVGSRAYVPGDPFHHIHWRNSARTGQAQVKEFETDPDDSIILSIDVNPSGQEDDEALEHAIRVAASVGDFVVRSGGSVNLLTGGENLTTSDRFALLMHLATAKGSEKDVPHPLTANASPYADVLALVRDTDVTTLEFVAQVARAQHRMRVVLMRGFDPENIPTNPVAFLEHAGATVVECWPEGVVATLQTLRRLSLTKESEIRGRDIASVSS